MPEINLAQEINAAPTKAFSYLVNQELLAKWLTPAVIAFPKKGTFAAFAMGNDINFKVEIIELVDNKLVKWKCIDGYVNFIGSEISFLLTGNENGTTMLEFTHSKLSQTVDKDKWKNNWQFYLATLSEVVQ